MRGALHVGAYRALKEAYGSLSFPGGIYGVSVGCMFAIAAAYDLSAEQVESIADRYFRLDTFLEELTLDHVSNVFETRGLMTTERLTQSVAEAFDSLGIDLRGKKMNELPQKVYFVSSNVTTGRSSLLTGDVPVLKALACSACIPFIFVPEVLNDHVHVDGGIFTRCMGEVVSPETLVVHISRIDSTVTPTSGSLFDMIAVMMVGKKHVYYKPNVLRIDHREVRMLDEVTPEQRQRLYADGYSQTRAFLAKRLAEKVE